MRGLLIAALCAVYSVQAWNENLGPLHIETGTGTVPVKYYPLTADDKHATRKAGAFVSFIKMVPQVNPLQLPSLGPYNVVLPDVNFQGDLILNNVLVQGLKSLSLSGLEVRMNPARLDFNVSIPRVSAGVNFELQGVLSNEPLRVNGQLSAVLHNLELSAAIGTKVGQLGQSQVYQVDTADVEIDVGEVQLSMNMNQYSEDFRVIVIQFLQNTEQYSRIVDDLLRAVLKAINKELTLITANEILQYLLGQETEFLEKNVVKDLSSMIKILAGRMPQKKKQNRRKSGNSIFSCFVDYFSRLSRPVNLTKIRITGLRGLQLNGLQWRMASNRVMCNATIPFLLVDVTFNNVQIELGENFGDEEFYTNIRLSVRLLDLEILASARYNIKVMLTDTGLFIDKAEVDINVREAMFELKVVQGLEEVRYILSELMNNTLEDIMDAVLKVVINEINKQLLKVDPKKVTNYLISKVPKNSKVPKELIVITMIKLNKLNNKKI